MCEIFLVNMPFAGLHLPSLALTQLKSVLDSEFGERVSVEIFYLNHDLAHYMGVDLYKYVSILSKGLWVGGWFFRQLAFPELADNTEEYFRRFYPRQDEQTRMFKHVIREKRQGLDDFLDELIAKYHLDRAGIVGFTSMFFQNAACFAMARKLKERNPDIIIVMGGANCEVPMGDAIVKNVGQIDFVFSGPALKSFPEFVGYCLEQEMEKCHRIDGVFSKTNRVLWPPQAASGEVEGSSDVVYVGPMGEELDINARIELDYGPFLDLVEQNFPNGEVETVLLFETSRGCWWGERSQCTFCGFNGANIHYRVMSPERAIEQFESLFRYTSRCPRLWAVDNIMPKNYPKEVFAHLDTPPGVAIGYHLRVDLSEEDVQMLSKGGVKAAQPGIEALATPTLKLMRKGTTAFRNLLFLKHCVMHDVSPWWNFLVGFPGEDKDVAEGVYKKYLRDIPLLLHLPPPIGVNPIRFDRYSHYFCHPEQYELDLRPFDFYELAYPFDEEVLADLAYFFADDRNFKAQYFTTTIKWIGKLREKVNLWWTRWHGEDQPPPPRLFFKGQGASSVVYDSRSGEVVEHQIGDVGRQVLEHLAKPRRIKDLAADLSHIPDFDPEKEVALLQERGLVFQEGERYMSLVLPEEPPPLALFPQGHPRLLLLLAVFPNVPLKSRSMQQEAVLPHEGGGGF
jgi:ribosomal peptide maturation radical SAM protein 1